MTVTVPPEIEARLRAEAARRGCDAEAYARQLIADHLPPPAGETGEPGEPAATSLAELFAQWEAADFTEDPAELARRQEAFDEFKAAMNRNRLQSEGAGARKVFP